MTHYRDVEHKIGKSRNIQLSADFHFVNLDPVLTFQIKHLNVYIWMKENLIQALITLIVMRKIEHIQSAELFLENVACLSTRRWNVNMKSIQIEVWAMHTK